MEENNNLGEFSNFMLYSSGESKVSVDRQTTQYNLGYSEEYS